MARILLPAAFVASILTSVSAAHAAERLPQHARGGLIYETLLQQHEEGIRRIASSTIANWAPNATANWKTSWLDNFNTAAGTYQQRFYYDTTFCMDSCFTTSPIIMEIGGEWTVNASVGGSPVYLANRTQALLIYLEHRYYGQSMPAPHTDKASMQAYLSVEQAIEDIAAFITYGEAFFSSTSPASKRSWAIVGGSYAGALVSWFTVKHGDMLAATWSSSGVVNAITNFTAFDTTVQTAVAGSNPLCPAALKAVTAAFEDAWNTRNQELLNLFNTPSYYSREDMAWMLADSAAMGPQYGFKDQLCGYLANSTQYLQGWDALVAFANWTQTHYGPSFGSSCYYSTVCLSNSSFSDSWGDGTTWVWQCCSEVAYWQVGFPGSYRSQWITTDYFAAQCAAAYGASAYPDTAAFNGRYGGAKPLVGSSRVFATQGSDDPWQPAGVEQPINGNYLEVTANCDGCSHCKDLHEDMPSDAASLINQREAVVAQMATWVLNPNTPGTNSPLSPGALAGIVVGAVVLLSAAGAFFFWRSKKSKRGGATSSEYAKLAQPDSGTNAKLLV